MNNNGNGNYYNGYNNNMNNDNMNNGYNNNMNNGNYNNAYNNNVNNGYNNGTPMYQYNNRNNMIPKPNNGFGIASLVLGILAILGIIVLIGPIIFAPLSIIFGLVQLIRKGPKSMAVMGIIASFLSIAILVTGGMKIMSDIESGKASENLVSIFEEATDSEEFESTYTSFVYGNWKYPEGAVLSLSSNGKWKFYKDGNNKTDNYYEGSKIVIKQGRDGLKEFGGNEDFVDPANQINQNKIYYIELYTDKLIVNGKDKVAAGEYDDPKQLVIKRLIVLPKGSFTKGAIVEQDGFSFERYDITKE